MAGLGLAELAARAHYPYDVLQSAEAGPGLPDLPVLSAYVRGCGGTTAEWEERWRSLTRSPASPLLPTRAAGCSDAATAGARIGTTAAPPDGHDSARIMAALDRVADGMAAPAAQSGLSDTPDTPGATVPGMRLPSVPDAAQSVFAASATPAAAPELASAAGAATGASGAVTGGAGTQPSVVSAVTARTARTARTTRTSAAHARGTVMPLVIAVLVAVALFLGGLVLLYVRKALRSLRHFVR
ncbi:MAG TPA: hypothetical protein VF482_14615 [Trebonia sp.]